MEIEFLKYKAYLMRRSTIYMTTKAQSGHVTSALSAADIISVLFFHAMRFDPYDPTNVENDRFILSKGHATPILYAVWHELGVISQEELATYREFNSILEGHPTPRFSRSEAATGSLGQGLSIGLGMALQARMHNRSFRTYVMMGDAESAEGSVWEAVHVAGYYNVHNLTALIDCNRLGQSSPTMEQHNLQAYANRFAAFGWASFIVDGHSIEALVEVFEEIKKIKDRPTVIIARTLKGYGISFVQDKEGFHGKALSKQDAEKALEELALHKPRETSYVWYPQLPPLEKDPMHEKILRLSIPHYDQDSLYSTREAYGKALLDLGKIDSSIVVLDADVQNSTKTDYFAKQFPDRFIQSFIAEQNMVGMAVGLSLRGQKAFVATFGAFFSRAYDQIRMAAIGGIALRLCGSHAGVSIGQDGPSQMALEDIALMRALPNSIIVYPCDAVSAYALMQIVTDYSDGISYVRTTRSETPVIYHKDHEFKLGGFGILHHSAQDVICVIAAGITVFEALKAYLILQRERISIAVVDLYSIKPIDEEALTAFVAVHGNRVITVEDHYLEGGLGQAVMYALRDSDVRIECLAVTKIPRSGSSQALLAYENIDAASIVGTVERMLN